MLPLKKSNITDKTFLCEVEDARWLVFYELFQEQASAVAAEEKQRCKYETLPRVPRSCLYPMLLPHACTQHWGPPSARMEPILAKQSRNHLYVIQHALQTGIFCISAAVYQAK